MPHTVQELAEFTASRLIGDGAVTVSKVASIAQSQPGELVFVQDEKDLASALTSPASAIMAGEFAMTYGAAQKPLLISASPRLAFCRAGTLLHPPKAHKPGVHPT